MVILLPLDKGAFITKISFLISQPKHMLWVFKRTVCLNICLNCMMHKKIFTILRLFFFILGRLNMVISWP